MSNEIKKSGNGITFLGLLAIVFITLKLCNVITWSWWWVTAPLWGGIALWGSITIIAVIIYFVALMVRCIVSRKS